jgi:signal transduction histidine kinase
VPKIASLLERVESWSARLYRLDPEQLRREQDFRVPLLRRLLLASGAAALLYLALGLAGVVSGRFFPYDALELLLAVAVCAWILRRGHTSTALTLPLVVYSHTASSIISAYGVDSPAVALFLPTILVCGLLVGGYFLLTWTIICGLLVLYLGRVHGLAGESAGLARPVLLWWALFAAVGWLVHLFTSHLEGLLHGRALMVEERNRIARDIHDTLAQGFTGVVVQLNAAEAMLAADPARSREHIATARELARASLEEARRSVWALRPADAQREGLAAGLERGARTLTAGTGIEIVMTARGAGRGIGVEAEWEVLRVGLEAVTNAVRHSGCRRITLRLSRGARVLRLEVEDDGKGGIIEGAPDGAGGLGLVGIRERAERLGGRLEVQSPPGGPTCVVLAIPGE